MNYQSRVNEHLAAYKTRHMAELPDGTWSYRGQPRNYPHILPKDQFELNILPAIRKPFWEWFASSTPTISRHRYFHHLNSSQALAFNLFYPFLTKGGRNVDARLLKVLGLPTDVPHTGEFEKVFDRSENTNFDFYLEGPGEHKVFFEVKYSESGFGSCVNDARHCEKLTTHYRPHLSDYVDTEWLEQKTFFKHYQILRNMSYLGRHAQSSLIFIFPKANESLAQDEQVIERMIARSLTPRVEILYLEDLVERILDVSAEDDALHDHFRAFQEKYVLDRSDVPD